MSNKYNDFFAKLEIVAETKIESDLTNVEITHLKHETEDFYCLTVPSGAFVVKHDDIESISGNCHALSGAASFQIAIQEMRENGTLTNDMFTALSNIIRNYAMKVKEHEFAIIDKIFEKGDKDNQKLSMQQFVLSRINLCLQNLGIHTIYSYDEIGENKVAVWFYKNLNMPVIGDFFVNLQSNYSRDWNETAFVVEPNKYTFEE